MTVKATAQHSIMAAERRTPRQATVKVLALAATEATTHLRVAHSQATMVVEAAATNTPRLGVKVQAAVLA